VRPVRTILGRKIVSLFAVSAGVLAVGGCGASTVASSPAPRAADFPSAAGKTGHTLLAGLHSGPIFAASVSVFRVGQNRYGFALFTPARKQITDAQAALYTADLAGNHLSGPYPARIESLSVKPQFESETVAKDPFAANSVYVSDVPLPKAGKYAIIALARVGGKLEAAGIAEAIAGQPGAPPDIGQRAISIHTPTVAQVGHNLASIDTRTPPAPDLQQLDFASVLHRKPVVLLFATPALCQSRVCGPVVDIEEQIKSEFGNRVAFIHMEIYNDNNVAKGFRPQVAAYRLPTEPWLFVINRNGVITTRIEGAFSTDELRAAVQQVA
jgi:hypothetical protein